MTNRFDEFSKSVAETIPRRETLRRLSAGFVAAVLSPLGLHAAPTARKVAGQDPCKAFCKCRNKTQQNACVAACNACDKDTSRLAGSCGNYFCCGNGLTSCGASCADLDNDPDNCGACGYMCEEPGPYETGACIAGRCEYWCVEGTVSCNGKCTSLDSDPSNCGACGNVCGEPNPSCYQGTCSHCTPYCPERWCGGDGCGGECACPSGTYCEYDGWCYDNCSPGLTWCDPDCVDLSSDPYNCGACGNVCGAATPYCSNGVCISGGEPCPGGATRCNGVCTNISFDTLNCGGCGIVCAPGETCSGGVCQFPF